MDNKLIYYYYFIQSVENGGVVFSSESQMTRFTLFCLLGIFGALSFFGFLLEVYTRRGAVVHMRSEGK